MLSTAIQRIILFGAMLCCGLSAYSQAEPALDSVLRGKDNKLVVGAKAYVQDAVIFDPILKPTIYSTNKVDNIITLRLDEYDNPFMPDSFQLSADIRVIYTNNNNLVDSADRTLTITYNKLRPYSSKAHFFFSGAHEVTVKVMNLTANYETLANCIDKVELENLMVIDRDYKMNCSTDAIKSFSTTPSSIAVNGELLVSWPTSRVAEEYDFEWTYIDNSAIATGRYNVSGVLNPNLIFKNNSTRVTVTAAQYSIPMLYEGDGQLFFRVRGAQTLANGRRNAMAWSSDFVSEGGLGQYSFSGFEGKLNWQSSTAFAEEGKRKSVVQFFDGSLKGRQTVTKDNSTQHSIVAETYYDKQGRPAIQVMPAPTLSSLMNFTPIFNRNKYDLEFVKGDYDTLANYCVDGIDSMSAVTSGAAHYYSDKNELKNTSPDGFIPNANGYAFSQTKYTQDNSGRMSSQGGVGPDFKLGSGHETKYYYGGAEQEDLDALFGTEVGDASHYQKNMVQDANGQLSISYVDMHGRTVATALAGEGVSNLDQLPSYAFSTETNQLLSATTNLVKDNSIDAVKGLLVTRAGTHTFTYSLTTESLQLNGCVPPGTVCYDCIYDLDITISDDCGNHKLVGDTAIHYSNRNISLKIDTTCAAALPFNVTLTANLPVGAYTITKRLTINQEAMNYYRDSIFMAHNTCKTYQDFVNEQRAIINAQLGDCAPILDSTKNYEQIFNQMLDDMTPLSGQYALLTKPAGAALLWKSIFSINPVTGRAFFATPTLQYLDEDGSPSRVEVIRNSVRSTVLPWELTQEEFIYFFKGSWAKTLLTFHPEKSLYDEYVKLAPSHVWDEDFEATDTYAQALAKGYLNPTASSTAPASQFTINLTDPLYSTITTLYGSTPGNSAKQVMQDSMFNFRVTPPRTYSMWGFSTVMGKCPSPMTDDACAATYNANANVFGTALCVGEKDMAWRLFRGLYLRAKQAYVEKFIHERATNYSNPPAGYISLFPSIQSLMNEGGYTNIFETNVSVLTSIGTSQFNAQADSACTQYAIRWTQQLATCQYTQTDLDSILPRLVIVCKQGTDATHPVGASSTAPSSTYQYQSFEAVILDYNSRHGIATNANCNSYLIDQPKPYEQASLPVDKPIIMKPEDCDCERISQLQNEFLANPGSSTTLSQWMLKNYQAVITQGALDTLIGLCSGTITCKYIPQIITLPPAMQCGNANPCIDCARFKAVYDSFVLKFPDAIPSYDESDSAQVYKNLLFQSYMNSKLGFGKLAVDYLKFKDTCALSGGGGSCDSLKQIITDFRLVRKEILENKAAYGFRLTPVLEEIKDGMNGLLEWKRRATNGRYLSPRYKYQPTNYSLVNKLYSISYTDKSTTDSIFNLVLPLNLKYINNPSGYFNKLLGTQSLTAADFGGTINPTDLAKRFYGVSLMEEWGRFRMMWGSKNNWQGGGSGCTLTAQGTYYGISSPDVKFLQDSICGQIGQVNVTAAFYPLPGTVTTIPLYKSYRDTVSSRVYAKTSNPNDDLTIATGALRDTLKNSLKLYHNVDIRRVVDFYLDTAWLRKYYVGSDHYDQGKKGDFIRAKLEMMDGSTQEAYFYASEYLNIYKEAVDTTIYGTDCQKGFAAYYNARRGTTLTYAQIAQRYLDSCGITLNVCDTAMSCSKLNDLVTEFENKFIAPASGYVDLPMRTFAGNITPVDGQKGIFNVNNQLIGVTSGTSVTAINDSYAKIWSSDAANRQVGSMVYLPNGLFRLTLKPGKQAPCQGIIGQRFYQFDVNVYDSAASPFNIGEGCYITFGDTTSAFTKGVLEPEYGVVPFVTIAPDAQTSMRFANYGWKHSENTNYMSSQYQGVKSFEVNHLYNKSKGFWKTYTITIYHPDVKGFMCFNASRQTKGGVEKPLQANMRGYWPQQMMNLYYQGTQDSTIVRTRLVNNFKQITSIQAVETSVRPPAIINYDLNLESFENNHNLEFLWYDRCGNDPGFPVRPGYTLSQIAGTPLYKAFPNIPKNFPKLRSLTLEGYRGYERELDSSRFDVPNLMMFNISYKDSVQGYQLDSMFNQVTRYNNNSQVSFSYGYATTYVGAYTAASLTARNKMNTLGWAVPGINTNTEKDASIQYSNVIVCTDSMVLTNDFTDYFNGQMGTKYTYTQIRQLFESKCGHPLSFCSPASGMPKLSGPRLCGQIESVSPPLVIVQPDACRDSAFLIATTATEIYRAYRDSLRGAFNEAYTQKCLNAKSLESFTVSRQISEYHFTLYYYDQAGNLVKTVSPSGVAPDHTSGYLSDVAAKRITKLVRTPLHTLNVLYRYNSLNQVVSQSSPDGGKSQFWYDRLGRLAISQNAKQKPVNKYSYTQYDDIGRIVFVGEKLQPQPLLAATLRSTTALKKWIEFRNDLTTYQPVFVTQTYYDKTDDLGSTWAPATPFRQKSRTLRNRVSYTKLFEIIPSTLSIPGGDTTYTPNYALFQTGTEYSYDIHGNVDSMLNLYWKNTPFFQSVLNKYKLIAYDYDLISGKVNAVHYNPGSVDEFYHRYIYDAENRLTDVYTTDTKVFLGQEGLEDHEAHYSFYRHGPLAREVIGQQQVQGVDYAYTLQGWIKGVNNTALTAAGDMGSDGRYTAKDAYSYNLNYFTGDYKAINGQLPFADHVARLDTGYHPLYNGNINSMAVNIRQFNQPQLYNYRYDQLNRITRMDVFRSTTISTTNSWVGSSFTGDYMERVAYDPNGNILKYLRQGSGSNQRMDSLSYFYKPGTNQVDHIQDRVNGGVHNGNYANDLDDQPIDNYDYDAIGNLIKDTANRIKLVDWNVYGKITKLTKVYPPSPTGTMRYTDYVYDPAGNRISKVSYPAIGEAPYVNVYVRDAQGNIMAEYEKRSEIYEGDAILKRHHLYGSSRLGIINRDQNTEQPKLTSTNLNLLGASYVSTFQRGFKNYEFTNHLGNVLVTISDKKSGPLDLAGHEIPARVEYSDPDVVTANDYFPFGMIQNGRNYNKSGAGDYKFGFNGKENDDQIVGEGNEQDYGMRIYDPRVAKFFSADPLTSQFPQWTPYQFAGNSPIWAVDLDGCEPDKKTEPIIDSKDLKEVVVTASKPKIKNRWGLGGPLPLLSFNYANFKTLATNLPTGYSVQDYTSASNLIKPWKYDEPSSIYSYLTFTKIKSETSTLTWSINLNHYKFLIMNGDGGYVYRFSGGLNEISINMTTANYPSTLEINNNSRFGFKFGFFYGWGAGILGSNAGVPHEIEGTGARAEEFMTAKLPAGYRYAGVGANGRAGALFKITKYFQIQMGLQMHANSTIPIKSYDASGNVMINQRFNSFGAGWYGGTTVTVGL